MDKVSVDLFEPYMLGDIEIKYRFGMASLTRQRCQSDGVPTDSVVKYYSERAESAGFVFTECSAVSPVGNSFKGSAAIYSKEQVDGWKKVTDAVHEVKGKYIYKYGIAAELLT
jgi:N-ethylmaleimide reductase